MIPEETYSKLRISRGDLIESESDEPMHRLLLPVECHTVVFREVFPVVSQAIRKGRISLCEITRSARILPVTLRSRVARQRFIASSLAVCGRPGAYLAERVTPNGLQISRILAQVALANARLARGVDDNAGRPRR